MKSPKSRAEVSKTSGFTSTARTVRGAVQQRGQDVASAAAADDEHARLAAQLVGRGRVVRAQERELLEVAVEGQHHRGDAVVDHDLPAPERLGLLGSDADHREGVPADGLGGRRSRPACAGAAARRRCAGSRTMRRERGERRGGRQQPDRTRRRARRGGPRARRPRSPRACSSARRAGVSAGITATAPSAERDQVYRVEPIRVARAVEEQQRDADARGEEGHGEQRVLAGGGQERRQPEPGRAADRGRRRGRCRS